MRALVWLALLTIRIRLSRPLEDTLEVATDTFDTEASDEKQYRLVTCVIFVMNGLEESFHFWSARSESRKCFGSIESFLASFSRCGNRQQNASRPYRTSFRRESIGNEPFANLKKKGCKSYQHDKLVVFLWTCPSSLRSCLLFQANASHGLILSGFSRCLLIVNMGERVFISSMLPRTRECVVKAVKEPVSKCDCCPSKTRLGFQVRSRMVALLMLRSGSRIYSSA